jgi:hypothetical protein
VGNREGVAPVVVGRVPVFSEIRKILLLLCKMFIFDFLVLHHFTLQ